jgi:hypothetical protein
MSGTTTARSVAAASVLGLLLLGSGSASAIPEPGPAAHGASTSSYGTDCQLERIESQLVRCDNLTGAGAEAPSSVPEQPAG